MNFDELQQKIKDFNKERDWDKYHNSKDLILALMSEVGELAEIYKWLNQSELEEIQTNPQKKTLIEEELADIFNYIIVLSYNLDIDLLKVTQDKLEKNKLKYPTDKIKGIHSNFIQGIKGN